MIMMRERKKMKHIYMAFIIILCLCCFGSCGFRQSISSDSAYQTTTPSAIISNSVGADKDNSSPSVTLKIEYSNEKPYKDLITIKYPVTQLDQLEEKYKKGTEILFNELSNEFKFECIRKAGFGYYVILMQDDGKRVFLFFNEELSLRILKRFTDFLSIDDFDFVKIGETTIQEVFNEDPNTYLQPFDSYTGTSHVVKEGGLLLYYKKSNGEIWANGFKFYENDELLNMKADQTVMIQLPYILDIDKQ
jgi:hypothetical protein